MSGVRDARNAVQHGLEFGVGDVFQVVTDRPESTHGRQAFLDIAAMSRQVLVDQLLQEIMSRQGQGLLLDQDPAQRLGFLQDPGVHRRDQGVASHEVHLHGQDAEEQVAVGVTHGRGLF